jgi:hypothetical protein
LAFPELLIQPIGEQIALVLAARMTYSDGAKYQFGCEQPLAEPTLALQHPAAPTASWTRHRASQQAGIFGGNPQIEFETAPRVLAGGAVNDTLGRGIRFVTSRYCLHRAHLLSYGRVISDALDI